MKFKIASALGALLLFVGLAFGIRSHLLNRSPGQYVLTFLREKYPYRLEKQNYNKVMSRIESLVMNAEDENWPILARELQKMHDAHLEFRPSNKSFLRSNLELALNNKRVLGPYLAKNFIVAVDNIPVEQWIEDHEHLVSYSSAWGRDFRTLALLESFPVSDIGPKAPQTVQLRSDEGEQTVPIIWSEVAHIGPCVSSFTRDNFFVLKIATFWCSNGNQSRQVVLANFRNEFDSALAQYRPNMKFIIDLRDNGGGGDEEMRYALAPFVSGDTFLYRFNYYGEDRIHSESYSFAKGIYSDKNLYVLVNSGCGSACEVFANILAKSAEASLIGFQTHGSAADPVTLSFEDWLLTFPRAKVWDQFDRLYEGQGVTPQILVAPSQLYNHEGDLLRYALKILSQKRNQSSN